MTTQVIFEGEEKLVLRLTTVREVLHVKLRTAFATIGMKAVARAKEKVHGEVLRIGTGTLSRKIHTVQDEIAGATIRQRVGLSLRYAAIHEYGRTIHHPGSSKFQAWLNTGEGFSFSSKTGNIGKRDQQTWIYTRGTKPHDIVMPERSYLRSSLRELQPWAFQTVREAVREALGQS